MTTEVAKRDGRMTLAQGHEFIRGMEERIIGILPKHLTPERMLRVLQNAVSRNHKLLECTKPSIANAIVTASELGLEPNTPLGLCHIIPYGGQATFQIGYQGLIELAYRSGRVRNIYAETVHERDTFRITLGLHKDLIHEPGTGDRGKPIAYYAVVEIDGIAPQFAVMTRGEVEAHGRKYSQSYARKDSAWQTSFDAMAKKTVIKAVLKYAPKSIDDKLAHAIALDDAIDTTATGTTVQESASVMDDLADQLEAEVSAPEEEHTYTADADGQAELG